MLNLIVLVFGIISGLNSKKIYCTSEQRIQAFCTADWKPVCGYKQENCAKEYCLKEYGNNCGACQDSEVLYTLDENCPVFEKPEINLKGIACSENTKNVKKCDEPISTVCGVACDGFGKCSFSEYINPCNACNTTIVNYYLEGKCKNEYLNSEIYLSFTIMYIFLLIVL